MRNYLSKENTSCMKGIFASIIFFVHVTQFHPIPMHPYINYIIASLGYLSVSVFFFLSGYGLEESYKRKNDYLNTFWKHRILPLYGTYLYVMAIYLLCLLALGRRFTAPELLKSVLLYSTIVNNGWFFFAIIVIYIIFYLTHRFLKGTLSQTVGVGIGLLLWCVACVCLHFGYWLWISVFAFLAGILWQHHKSQIDEFVSQSNGYIIMCLSAGIGFGITWLIGHMYSLPEVVYLAFQMVSTIFFVGFVMLLCMQLPISCRITSFLGKHSKYIYAMHGLVLNILSNFLKLENTVLYLLLAITGSLLLAVAAQRIYDKLISQRTRK